MSIRVQYQVRCDNCSAEGRCGSTELIAEDRSKKKGWIAGQCYGTHLHLCPSCVEKGLPDWWPDESGTRFHWESDE